MRHACVFMYEIGHIESMRTNIDIDDSLMNEALQVTGAKTKKAAVEEGLRLLVRLAAQRRAVEDMMGLGWEGDLDESRLAGSH